MYNAAGAEYQVASLAVASLQGRKRGPACLAKAHGNEPSCQPDRWRSHPFVRKERVRMWSSRTWHWSLIVALAGCSAAPTAQDSVGTASQEVIAFGHAVTPSGGPRAAETSTLINSSGNLVITYMYDDPGHIKYTTSTDPNKARTVSYGASQMGWSVSSGGARTDGLVLGATFSAPKRLTPPSGWAVLWGDPAIGQVPGTPFVYMTNLAVPNSKFPCARRRSGRCVTQGVISGDFTPYMGGACIARSTDGGVTFSLSSADCVHSPSFDFYDGSEVVGSTNVITGAHAVVAAFTNSITNHIDVWAASSTTGGFSQLGNPFPNEVMGSHPRLLAWGDQFYLLGVAGNRLLLQRYDSAANSWASAADGYPKVVATDFNEINFLFGSGTFFGRRGVNFDLAVDTWDDGFQGDDAILVAYTSSATSSAGRLHSVLMKSYCSLASGQTCFSSGLWDLPRGDALSPNLSGAVVRDGSGAWTTALKLTFIQQAPTDPPSPPSPLISIYSGNMGASNGGMLTDVRLEVGFQKPCTTTIPGSGFWGDYDAHMGVYQKTEADLPVFFRAFSDSTDGHGNSACTSQTYFNSAPLQVSYAQIRYP
ncbi:MAG: hypothetical protein M3O46_03675, partial [Myxococcota bacterium]|nr:hypothetical protein [Myxococcota bacterium]